MKKKLIIAVILLFGIGIFRVPILRAVTGAYNQTVRIVDSSGNVISGVASAVTGMFNETVRVVDSTGHVIDSFGGGSGAVTNPALANYVGSVGLTGNQGTGADFINAVCLNGVCPVTAFGASGLGTTFTVSGTVNSGSTTIPLTTNYDGTNGSSIKIPGAGASQGFTQPSAPTVTVGTEYDEVKTIAAGTFSPAHVPTVDVGVLSYLNGYPYQPVASGAAALQYSFAAPIFSFNAGNNGTVTVAQYITAGAQGGGSNHTYQIAPADDACGYGQASTTTTVSIATQAFPNLDLSNGPGNGTIASANATGISLPAYQNGNQTMWLIYKDGALFDITKRIWLAGTGGTPVEPNTWVDNGQATPAVQSCIPSTPPAAASADFQVVKVTGGGGTSSLTISTPTTTTITGGTIAHDDTASINAACAASIPSSGGSATRSVFIPDGTYLASSNINCSPASGVVNGFHFDGQGNNASSIKWDGGPETNILTFAGLNRGEVSNIYFSGAASQADLVLSNPSGNVTADTISDITCTNPFHHCIKGGLATDSGGVSEINVVHVLASGSTRNWAAFEVQGANNTNWAYYNTSCGTGNSPYPTCWSDSALLDFTDAGGTGQANQTSWYNAALQGNPKTGLGVPCTHCGAVSLGGEGSYNFNGIQAQNSGMFFGLNSGSPRITVNLNGVYWLGPTLATQHDLILDNDTNLNIVSNGTNWDSPLTIDMKAGTYTGHGDLFYSAGHATIQGYFSQTILTTPRIQLLSAGLWQGPLNAPTLIGSIAAGISGGGSLSTGSNSFAGTVTSSAATGNVVTPGFTCTNAMVAILGDRTTLGIGGAQITAVNGTTFTFSSTLNDTVDYHVSCR